MRLPRDLSGSELARALQQFGYRVVRQTGSHMRLTRSAGGADHHLTIPAHNPLKVGTLSQILADAAGHLGISREDLQRKLFS